MTARRLPMTSAMPSVSKRDSCLAVPNTSRRWVLRGVACLGIALRAAPLPAANDVNWRAYDTAGQNAMELRAYGYAAYQFRHAIREAEIHHAGTNRIGISQASLAWAIVESNRSTGRADYAEPQRLARAAVNGLKQAPDHALKQDLDEFSVRFARGHAHRLLGWCAAYLHDGDDADTEFIEGRQEFLNLRKKRGANLELVNESLSRLYSDWATTFLYRGQPQPAAGLYANALRLTRQLERQLEIVLDQTRMLILLQDYRAASIQYQTWQRLQQSLQLSVARVTGSGRQSTELQIRPIAEVTKLATSEDSPPDLAPSHPPAHERHAYLLFAQAALLWGSYREAERLVQEVDDCKSHPNDAECCCHSELAILRARLHVSQEQFAKASRVLDSFDPANRWLCQGDKCEIQGQIYLGLGDFPRAVCAFEDAIRHKEKHFNSTCHLELCESLLGQGWAYQAQRDYCERVLAICDRVNEISTKSLDVVEAPTTSIATSAQSRQSRGGARPPDTANNAGRSPDRLASVARSLRLRAQHFFDCGCYSEVRGPLEAAQVTYANALLQTHVERLSNQHDLARMYWVHKHFDDAQRIVDPAAKIISDTFDSCHSLAANSATLSGWIQHSCGDYEAAGHQFHCALAIWQGLHRQYGYGAAGQPQLRDVGDELTGRVDALLGMAMVYSGLEQKLAAENLMKKSQNATNPCVEQQFLYRFTQSLPGYDPSRRCLLRPELLRRANLLRDHGRFTEQQLLDERAKAYGG